jgi:hypothetical protein
MRQVTALLTPVAPTTLDLRLPNPPAISANFVLLVSNVIRLQKNPIDSRTRTSPTTSPWLQFSLRDSGAHWYSRDKLRLGRSNGFPFQIEEKLGEGSGADERWPEWGCWFPDFNTECQWTAANKGREEWRWAEPYSGE